MMLGGISGYAEILPPDNQVPPRTEQERRDARKNLVVKEINTDGKGKKQWMDHLTVWNEYGYKIEEIEYAVYGQKERVTFEYDADWRCIRENVYNDKNKLYRIRKFEYNEDGRKKIQYNYNPDGKLYTTKVFDYSYTSESSYVAKTPERTEQERRDARKNLVTKEVNTDSKGKRQWMDRLAVWNEEGYKTEDIEYAVYGQKERVTYEYDENWKCIRENVYNDKNKLYRIRKFDYNAEGKKIKQYNYNPDGKLYSTKIFEYSFRD